MNTASMRRSNLLPVLTESSFAGFCRAPQEPAINEKAAQTIGQQFGFEGLPNLLSRMLKGVQKQT